MHRDLGHLLENGKFSDLIIECEGKQFNVHKNILAARSSTFAKIFEDGTIKSHETNYKITEVRCKIMRQILQFIYTERVNIESDMAYELLIAAHRYQLQDLKLNCQEVLSENLNIGNVAHIHVLAEDNDAKWLKEKTMNFIIANAREVIDTQGYKTLTETYPQLLDEIYRETVKRQN